MSEEPEENQWNLGSDKEIQEAAKQSRKQPMTAERMGEYVGGFIGVFVGAPHVPST